MECSPHAWLQPIFAWFQTWRESRLGQRGERAAERFLRRQGFVIVARGDRAKLGEIDLIGVDKRTVVFVEVKTRSTNYAGNPADAVDNAKQHRLTRAAMAYLKLHSLHECSSRFDVVAITWPPKQKRPVIEHIRNAFEATV